MLGESGNQSNFLDRNEPENEKRKVSCICKFEGILSHVRTSENEKGPDKCNKVKNKELQDTHKSAGIIKCPFLPFFVKKVRMVLFIP
jgi:hypothetical protein